MLHTRVRCRARVWDVLDVHEATDATTWHLLRDHDTPRLIASPPDRVEPMPVRTRPAGRRAWARHVLASTRTAPSWWPVRAERLPITLVPWQLVPAMLVLSGHHRRLLLADEVGMGKTIQAAVLLQEIHARDAAACTLAIVPAGLLAQWQDELRTKVGLDAVLLDADALRREAARPSSDVDASRAGACWLVSIDMLRQADVVSLLARTPWTLLVVDEAHLAAPGTARLTAVQRVAAASARALLLSATPTAGGPQGLTTLRAIGERPHERPMAVARRPAALLARPARRTHVQRIRLDAAHEAVCARLDRFADRARREYGASGLLPALVLRRRACSSPAALIRSLERRLDVLATSSVPALDSPPGLFDMLAGQDEEDELLRLPAWRDERRERAELEAVLRDARALDPVGRKLDILSRLVTRVAEPIIVFTSYVDTLRALRNRLTARRIVIVHGSQPDAIRADAIAAFCDGDADLLLTTDASAEGLNLQARCRFVIHTDLPPSARVLEQRIGRVDRYGQSRRVHAVLLASCTEEDNATLDRLTRRSLDEEAWLGPMTGDGVRRTRVAMRVLTARRAPDVPDASRAPTRRQADVATCALAPSRYRRLAARLRLPTAARALWVGTLTVTGDAPLSSSAWPVVLASRSPRPPTSLAAWQALLPGTVRRAMRLVRRMHEWASAAEDAARVERSRHDGDLFGMGTPGRRHVGYAHASSPIGTRRGTTWVHAQPHGVLVCREPGGAGSAS